MSDIQHAHLSGMREAKYDWLSSHDVVSTEDTAINGTKDENVFDIQQGVAVCIMIKDQGGT